MGGRLTVRCGQGEFRFRLSLEELEALSHQGRIQERLGFGLEVLIQSLADSSPPSFEVEPGPTMTLTIPAEWCFQLTQARSRQGLSFQQSGMTITLQWDLRSQ